MDSINGNFSFKVNLNSKLTNFEVTKNFNIEENFRYLAVLRIAGRNASKSEIFEWDELTRKIKIIFTPNLGALNKWPLGCNRMIFSGKIIFRKYPPKGSFVTIDETQVFEFAVIV